MEFGVLSKGYVPELRWNNGANNGMKRSRDNCPGIKGHLTKIEGRLIHMQIIPRNVMNMYTYVI